MNGVKAFFSVGNIFGFLMLGGLIIIRIEEGDYIFPIFLIFVLFSMFLLKTPTSKE
tara:strand:- start:371 stop:538 length:168 start_codon:yes stop_codon:yes gene_type:complete